jgi:hypothetical protein
MEQQKWKELYRFLDEYKDTRELIAIYLSPYTIVSLSRMNKKMYGWFSVLLKNGWAKKSLKAHFDSMYPGHFDYICERLKSYSGVMTGKFLSDWVEGRNYHDCSTSFIINHPISKTNDFFDTLEPGIPVTKSYDILQHGDIVCQMVTKYPGKSAMLEKSKYTHEEGFMPEANESQTVFMKSTSLMFGDHLKKGKVVKYLVDFMKLSNVFFDGNTIYVVDMRPQEKRLHKPINDRRKYKRRNYGPNKDRRKN